MTGRSILMPPEQLEEYRILRPLNGGAISTGAATSSGAEGEGGQSYLAQDTLLDRSVVIKFIAPLDLLPSASSKLPERFFNEARAIARLRHPNLGLVYGVGEWQQRAYLVVEFLRGVLLDRVDKPLPWPRVQRIAVGLSRGLAAAHRSGILRRGIRPGNVVLTAADEVKLLDVGLVKLVELTQFASGSNPALGGATPQEVVPVRDTQLDLPAVAPHETGDEKSGDLSPLLSGQHPSFGITASSPPPHPGDALSAALYLAPEVWRGEPATRQADVYSLGSLLYELCAGRAPNDGLSLGELPLRVQDRDPRPLAEAAPDIDPRFCAIVDRCLRRTPSARYESADALRAALEELNPASHPGPVSEGNRIGTWFLRRCVCRVWCYEANAVWERGGA